MSTSFLFPIISGKYASGYKQDRLALGRINRHLKKIAVAADIKVQLTTYTARHTWATTAYYCEIHPGIISEAMGHSSITVTETYLKPFRSKKIDEANKQVLDFVKRSVVGVSA